MVGAPPPLSLAEEDGVVATLLAKQHAQEAAIAELHSTVAQQQAALARQQNDLDTLLHLFLASPELRGSGGFAENCPSPPPSPSAIALRQGHSRVAAAPPVAQAIAQVTTAVATRTRVAPPSADAFPSANEELASTSVDAEPPPPSAAADPTPAPHVRPATRQLLRRGSSLSRGALHFVKEAKTLAEERANASAPAAAKVKKWAVQAATLGAGLPVDDGVAPESAWSPGMGQFEDMHLEDSIWDAAMLIGMEPVGQAASWFLAFLFLSNAFAQGIFLMIIATSNLSKRVRPPRT